ncbi:FecCD family ABC transporter permease [Natribacillus halophilus]|uniref:Iron complex transport system permease protein n=1 Tax=Natribacillus halophilus TaxID=549003 RepID=A0A1G8SQ47_9BACI|nr:iron ABC transporter permease [Natribacillus halophilus]SDJ30740.1 iron complex transport system permease protein [Natribacillus halophilus]
MKRTVWIYMAIVVLIFAVFLLSLQMGTMSIAPLDVWRTLMGDGTEQHTLVLFEFRLPRMVIALLVGAGLAVSGAILQSLSRNELADPGILGINAGAGLAVVLFIYFFQGSYTSLGETIFALPLFAFVGAITAAFLIYTLAWKKGVTPIRLVLVGIGLNAGFTAILIVFQLRMNPEDFMQATVWLNGDIWGTSWSHTLAVLPWMLLFIPLVIAQARTLNVMRLGDPSAVSLGVKVERNRRRLLILAVMLAGASVSVGGAISFLGLVAPHIARRLVGPRHQVMVPTAAMVGAFILLFADMVGRNLLSPSEIPVGIVVAVIGAPYFLYLLMKTP